MEGKKFFIARPSSATVYGCGLVQRTMSFLGLQSPLLDDLKGMGMKYAGLLVMPTGFFLAIAALVLFPEAGMRAMFVVCAVAVEFLGLAVAVRGHMEKRGREPTAARGAVRP